MKSFVVQTYYQLMHSIAMALTFEEKPMLYFAMRYLDVDEDFLDRIRSTGIFRQVVGITRRGDLTEFVAELDKTKGISGEEVDKIGSELFDKYLEPYFGELFKDADRDEDIYIYNDYHWYFYYITKHFKNIVGAEDGYASLTQQLKVHKFAGDRELVKPFLGKYYPVPGFRHPKVSKIISSRDFDDLPEEISKKVKVIDFNDLVAENSEAFKDAINTIFQTEDLEVKDYNLLFLAQPLARSTYCLSIEEYLLNKKIIGRELSKGNRICFKSHPADSIDSRFYEREGIRALPRTFPVEVLNYKDCEFDKTLSFGSTGVETLSCSRSNELIFGDRNAERKEVEKIIKNEVKDEKAVIHIYMTIRDLNEDVLVNVFSGAFSQDKYFRTCVNLLVPEEIAEEAGKYFRKDKLLSAIEKYSQDHMYKGICLVKDDLNKLKNAISGIDDPRIIKCSGKDDRDLIEAVSSDEGYDYAFFVDQNNLMFSPVRRLTRSLRKQVESCIIFPSYTLITNKKMGEPWISSLPGFADRAATGSIMNKALHRVLVQSLQKSPESDPMGLINSFGSPKIFFEEDLYIPYERFIHIQEGEKYYGERISAWSEKTDPDDSCKHISEEIYSYLNWLQLSDRKYGAEEIHGLLQNADISDSEKIRALEALCSTLYFEKYRRFRAGFGPGEKAKDYLRDKIGISEKTDKLIALINKFRRK